MLITLAARDKIRSVEDVNRIVSAEIPDSDTHTLANETIAKSMVHGPCGVLNPNSPCMINGKCSKHYPKKFAENTFLDDNYRPIYRRRNNGRTIRIKNFELDNRWIVPYNLELVTRYDAHINVELCTGGQAIKYLYKYVHKGFDHASFLLNDQQNNVDEIKSFVECRYISAVESCWRIFNFDLHHRFPPVQRLSYHLPEQQTTVFKENEALEDICNRLSGKTMFTEWFETNKISDFARTLTYVQFPEKWVWNEKYSIWKPRKKGISVGRLPTARIESGDLFYLRMLLNVVRGACSYEDLRTVNNITYQTFKEACAALGLLQDDSEWDNAMLEASKWATAWQLRHLFVSILLFAEVIDVNNLWKKYWKDLSDDFQTRVPRDSLEVCYRLSDDALMEKALLHIECILNRNGKSLNDYPSMPKLKSDFTYDNRLIFEELDYDREKNLEDFHNLHAKLTVEQKTIFEKIVGSVEKNENSLYFVNGGGGTGKTFLWKTLISKVRSEGKIILAVASSGIASLLLPGGRTAHSRFKIPLDLFSYSTCSISQSTHLSELIHQTKMVIWDEAPMMHRYAFDAVDRTFRDVLGAVRQDASQYVFGGMTVVFGGDFRQILPVIPKAQRNEIVENSIHKSNVWNHCIVYCLTRNMRLSSSDDIVNTGETDISFAKWITDIGDGCVPVVRHDNETNENWIRIPENILIDESFEDGVKLLLDFVYPDLLSNYEDPLYLCRRAILAPRNDEIDMLNLMLLDKLPEPERLYCSYDSALPKEGTNSHEAEYCTNECLHSMNFNGIPPHILKLKVCCPIILLRNINQSIGLCNGTRLIVRALYERTIDAEFISGNYIGQRVYIPKIVFVVTQTKTNFILKRRQFPVKLAFAMTINKSQGQTLDFVGIYLNHPVFCHGQLYVALSRVTSRDGIKILIPSTDDPELKGCTKNIVYAEIFEDIKQRIQTM